MATRDRNPKIATASTSSERGQGHATGDLPLCQKLRLPFGDALSKFLKELHDTRTVTERSAGDLQLDFHRQAREAYDSFLRAQGDEKAAVWKNIQGLQVQSVEELQDTQKKAAKRADDAYRAYLSDMQAAWANTDVNQLDAPSLGAICQSIQVAAYYAYALRAGGNE